MRELQTFELQQFRGFLSAMEVLLSASNQSVWLGSNLFDLEDSEFSTNALLELERPGYMIPEAVVIERELEEMDQRIEHCLKLSNPPFAQNESIEKIEDALYQKYKDYVSECIDISHSDTIILERDERLNPDFPIVRWAFDYIIHDRKTRHCLHIYGALLR